MPGLTDGPAAYAVSFLPSILVMGLGMAITITPLSAAVMSSVNASQAGLASGINNAVSRTAGVLGIAVLGALALLLFGRALAVQTAPLALPPDAQTALAAQAARLGEAQPPPDLPAAAQTAIRAAIRVALISAGLAGLAALVAALTIERQPASP